MEEGKGNINYSTEDIRKYLEGQLSDPEMQALEKAALEDPFLADAMEGLEESRNQGISFESGLGELNKRLRDRIHQKERKKGVLVFLLDWRVAASILFVIGTAILTYTFINNKSRHTEIATKGIKDSNQEKSRPLPAILQPDSTIAAINNAPEKINVDKSIPKNDKIETEEKKSRIERANPLNQPAPDRYLKKEVGILPDSARDKAGISVVANDIQSSTPAKTIEQALNGKAPGLTISKAKAFNGNYIRGIVIDSTDKPIPFASVSIPGSKKGTSTDDHGYFKLYLNNIKYDKEIVITGTGYQPLSATLNPDSSVMQKFQMQPASTSLNDVVVMGYSSENREIVSESYTRKEVINKAQPSGWDSLYNYINTNKKILTADSVLKGEEIISFVINNKGELSSFKILKSVSPVHDAEIIRLIKSGPALKIKKGRKQTCQLSVTFN